MHERFGTYGAWLNPALGDKHRIDTPLNSKISATGRSGWGSVPIP